MDEHTSSVGYETRIEAAVRTFRNHYEVHRWRRPAYSASLFPRASTAIDGKTLFLPDWDHLSFRLVAANLKREGLDARLLRDTPERILAAFGVRREHTGESTENLLKIHYTLKYHPDLSLFVQVSPAFFCPALVTEAMSSRIEQITGVPVVAVTYDGIGGSKNDVIIPYLKSPRMRPAART